MLNLIIISPYYSPTFSLNTAQSINNGFLRNCGDDRHHCGVSNDADAQYRWNNILRSVCDPCNIAFRNVLNGTLSVNALFLPESITANYTNFSVLYFVEICIRRCQLIISLYFFYVMLTSIKLRSRIKDPGNRNNSAPKMTL